jgi:glycosyltransferase involved in cell wall biosynthesis
MQNKLFFSLIIPTYNRGEFIRKNLESVLQQSYPYFEIIVVDDGSTDDTEKKVREISSDKIIYHKIENSERGFARNYGAERAKGDYISFLDSDDTLLPDYFKNANETILKHQYPEFVHLGYEIVNESGTQLYKVDDLRNNDIYCLVKGNPLSCAGCFLRKDVKDRFKFNTDRELSGSEDWELWFRVLANCGIKTDNRISSRMLNHSQRSVVAEIEEKKLILRKELALKYAFEDEKVKEHFRNHYALIDAYGESYISLHLALLGKNKRSIEHLKKFLRVKPTGIFTKRFLVITKYLVLNFFKRTG